MAFLPSSRLTAAAFCVCCPPPSSSPSSLHCAPLRQTSSSSSPSPPLPHDTHNHLHTSTSDLGALPPSSLMSLCLSTTDELLIRGAASPAPSPHVFGIGLHPWKVSLDSVSSVDGLREKALALVEKGRRSSLLLMAGETGLDFSMLKRLPPPEREAHKAAQLSCLSVLASLRLPLSLHCVKCDVDLRSALSGVFNEHEPPAFLVLHGYSFKDVGAWLKWSDRVGVPVYFGVCGRHVSTKVDLNALASQHPVLRERLLLESDSLSLETWEGEMAQGIDMVEGIDWTANWRVCADVLERERAQAN
eukprot:CAMPEP_0182486046 /NCGR_PEP_ID=MMETSP1319-20130603/46351_1 /TAXON_ID=172717 /ORGANISM="Bolidomonas pacifica, Strain RCC208" /LENGTH=302 /DNA_ID=CAMNT_0024688099 /DNA_START=132 /DNA_END=1037 /DNA_ORIENTATION=-